MDDVLQAYDALATLRRDGLVQAVGVGAKDWTVIREIARQVELDWVMLACSYTVYSHPAELVELMEELAARGIAIINSAVFHSGFLTGGRFFDYREPDARRDAHLFQWRERFSGLCSEFGVRPADACVQYGLRGPGVVAVALNTSKPERVQANVSSVRTEIPEAFWTALGNGDLL
jgi:D-threo-aldose 1-dehydrogenase